MNTPFTPHLFPVQPTSDLAYYLGMVQQLVAFRPDILEAIAADQERHALRKKHLRVLDAQQASAEVASQQVMIPDLDWEPHETVAPTTLNTGRPRMKPEHCFFFWMFCTYAGGVKSHMSKDLLRESQTITQYCLSENIRIPGGSTLAENFAIISEQTQQLILDSQIAFARANQADDFSKCAFDSTMVAADVAWPKDSTLMWELVRRAYSKLKKIKKMADLDLELPNLGDVLVDMKRLDFQINVTPSRQKELRTATYNELLGEAEDVSQRLPPVIQQVAHLLGMPKLKPSKRLRCNKCLKNVERDLEDLDQVIMQCHLRINEATPVKARHKVLSGADRDAALMVKGDREPVIGYHVQLAMSEMGLITAISVPKGYSSDAKEMQGLCKQIFERTQTIPEEVAADGGYASRENYLWLSEQSVAHPSFSSSKGKKLIGEADWNSERYKRLRSWRATIEGLIGRLKNRWSFGKVARRGLERVRAELTEKVIAFNFMRLAKLTSS